VSFRVTKSLTGPVDSKKNVAVSSSSSSSSYSRGGGGSVKSRSSVQVAGIGKETADNDKETTNNGKEVAQASFGYSVSKETAQSVKA
jgi:hypothetical protein